jgi:hypothetical protein
MTSTEATAASRTAELSSAIHGDGGCGRGKGRQKEGGEAKLSGVRDFATPNVKDFEGLGLRAFSPFE